MNQAAVQDLGGLVRKDVLEMPREKADALGAWDVDIPADHEHTDSYAEQARDYLLSRGYDPNVVDQFMMGLNEALINVAEHGLSNDVSEQMKMRILHLVDGEDRVWAHIHGNPFDYSALDEDNPSYRGNGDGLMQEFLDRVIYLDNGRDILLVKRLPKPEGGLLTTEKIDSHAEVETIWAQNKQKELEERKKRFSTVH